MRITGDSLLNDECYVDRCENQRSRRHDVHFDLQNDELMPHIVSIQYISPLN